MSLTIDRATQMANLMLAYKNNDLSKFNKLLERCEKWMDPFYYNFFFNLSKSSLWTRKGYYK